MPLRLAISGNACRHDRPKVVFVKRYFSSKKQSQGIKLSGIEFLTLNYAPVHFYVAKIYEKFLGIRNAGNAEKKIKNCRDMQHAHSGGRKGRNTV